MRRRVWPFSRATTARISVVAAAAFIAAVPTGQSATRDAAVGAGGDDRMRPPTNVVQGDTVRFRWEDGGHDLVLTGPETTRVDGRQDRDFVLTRKLDRAGTYTMLCTLHDNMDATFTVAAAPGAPANEGREFDEVDVVVAPDGDTGVAPRDVTVEEGQTVLWHWGDDNQSVRFADGQGGSGTIGGTPYSRRFDTVGTYAYSGGGGSGTVNVVAPRGPGWLGIRKAAAGTTPNARITVGSGNSYSPTAVTIDEGGTVEWSWAGGFHNVKFEDGTKTEFKSSGTEAYTFYTPSATPLRFVCEAHSGMEGTVTVRDTGAPGPNTQAPAPDTGGGDTGGGDTGGGDTGGTPAAATVNVGGAAGNAFSPANATVQTVQAVSFSWAGGAHNVHFADGPNSGVKSSGTWTRKFFNPGTYAYVCDLHSGMAGTVVAEGDPVADDGTGVVDGGGAGGTTSGGDGSGTTSTTTTDQTSTRMTSGGTSTATASSAGATAATADRTRPTVRAARALLARGRRAHRLRLTVDEDVMLQVTLQRLSGGDLVGRRSFRLYARKGTRTLRLPVMNLVRGRYRLRFVAVDRAGNRAAARTLTVRVR